MEIGQVCVKLAGRDAGQYCVVVDVLDGNFVLVDGNTRRRKCNIRHLEPIHDVLSIKENASHEDIIKAMKSVGIKILEAKKGDSGKSRKDFQQIQQAGLKSVKKNKPVTKRKALLKEVKAEAKSKTVKDEKKTKAKVEKK